MKFGHRKQRDRLTGVGGVGSDPMELEWDCCCFPACGQGAGVYGCSLRSAASLLSGTATVIFLVVLAYFTVQNHYRLSATELELENSKNIF